jgi:hypothetical protein
MDRLTVLGYQITEAGDVPGRHRDLVAAIQAAIAHSRPKPRGVPVMNQVFTAIKSSSVLLSALASGDHILPSRRSDAT